MHGKGEQPTSAKGQCPFSRLFGRSKESLADTLRERTKDAHTKAEKHPQQGRLVKGEADRVDYAAWLRQMLPIWQAIDDGLAAKGPRDPRIAKMVKPYHAHAHRIEADLAFLGDADPKTGPLAATAKFVEAIRTAGSGTTPAIVGIWYVLEGSANGGRFIAKALSRSLNIPGPEGLTSMDPHGEAQRDRWQMWRADLDAQAWTDEERADILASADATFHAIYDVLEDLSPMAERV